MRIRRGSRRHAQTSDTTAPDKATYAAWRAASFFGSDAPNDAISGPLADPDGAGVSNFYRYSFSLAARGAVANPVTIGTADTAAGPVLTLTFPRRAEATDLSYSVESSPDLITWTAGPGADPVTAEDAVALGAAPRRFLRLRITPL